MTLLTARNKFPLLSAGQAQKEITHNEALVLIDALVAPVVQSVAPANIPTNPTLGEAWIVGPAPSGAWQGHPHALAIYTEGGWRFVDSYDGFAVWSVANAMIARFSAGSWTVGIANASAYRVAGVKVVGGQQPAIPGPVGGTTIDQEARISVNAILAALRSHGLIAP